MIVFSLFLLLELCNAESEHGTWQLDYIRTNSTDSMPSYQEYRTENFPENTTERSGSLFSKLPDALVDRLRAFTDYGCETAEFYYYKGNFRAFEQRLNLMANPLMKTFRGLLSDSALYSMARYFWLQGMIGYFDGIGASDRINENWRILSGKDLQVFSPFMTEYLGNSLKYISWDSCVAMSIGNNENDKGRKLWHQTMAENHDQIIRGPIKLIAISFEQGRLSNEEDDEDISAFQEIVNESSSPQKVILEKDIVTSLTISHTTTDEWNWEFSKELGVSDTLKAETFGIGAEVTVSFSQRETNGKSGSSSDENSRSKGVSKIFRFELEAPPCTKITGRVSVTRETNEMRVVKTFKIGEKIVTINGTIEQQNALTQRFIVQKTDQIENCKADDTEDHCAIGTMDETILPLGDHEWICSARKNKTFCRAICKNGKHDDDPSYKVYCNHSTTFWYKENSSQEILDCL